MSRRYGLLATSIMFGLLSGCGGQPDASGTAPNTPSQEPAANVESGETARDPVESSAPENAPPVESEYSVPPNLNPESSDSQPAETGTQFKLPPDTAEQ